MGSTLYHIIIKANNTCILIFVASTNIYDNTQYCYYSCSCV